MELVSQQDKTLEPGLYLTATPIGCLEDMTLRALRVLRDSQAIYCEDSRVSRKLLLAYDIDTPLFAYHDHNADEVRPRIIQRLQRGEVLALISDAGTPLVADPGFKLVRECWALGLHVTTVPGASAILSASLLSGFPTAPLTFLGFASRLHSSDLSIWAPVPSTLVFFEAPHKLVESLKMLKTLFPCRRVAVLRELTKKFEERIEGDFDAVLEHFSRIPPRGEIAVVLSPPCERTISVDELTEYLNRLPHTLSCRDAVAQTVEGLHLPKSVVYEQALKIWKDRREG